jgi:hypothetical protein
MSDPGNPNGTTTSGSLGSGGSAPEAGLRQAGEDLRATARQAREAASQAASTISAEASAAAGTLKQEGAALLDTARTRAETMAQEGVQTGVGQVEGVARAIHRAASELEGESPQLARTIHDAAGAIDNMARAMRDRSPGDMLRGAEDFARRQPLVFFGAAALAGFALARFARSSAEHDRMGQMTQPMRQPYGTTGTGMSHMGSGTGMGAGLGTSSDLVPDTMHDMSTAGTGATGSIASPSGASPSTGSATYPGGPSTPHDTASGAPGWVADEDGTPRPATLASASLGGSAAYRARGENQG